MHETGDSSKSECAEGDPREGDDREESMALLGIRVNAGGDVGDDWRRDFADVLGRPLVSGDRTANDVHHPGDGSPKEFGREGGDGISGGRKSLEDRKRRSENRQTCSNQEFNDDGVCKKALASAWFV